MPVPKRDRPEFLRVRKARIKTKNQNPPFWFPKKLLGRGVRTGFLMIFKN